MTTTTSGGGAAWFCLRCCFNFISNVVWRNDNKNALLLKRRCTRSGSKFNKNKTERSVTATAISWSAGSWRYHQTLSSIKLPLVLLVKHIYKTDIIAMGFFYAVARGRVPGVYMTWSECESQVKGFPAARFKKFPSQSEAEAFIEQHKDGSRGGEGLGLGMMMKKSTTRTKQTASVGVNQVDGYSGGGQRGEGRSALGLGQSSSRIKGPSQALSSAFTRDGRKTMVCEPQELLSCAPSRNISTSGSLGKRGTSKIASDNKEFVTGKGNKRLKMCDNKRVDLSSFEIDDDEYVVVYTDGACKSNGKGQARAGIGVYFGESHFLNISERVKTRQTNNTAEIQAAERAIRCAKQYGIEKLSLKTDSQFVLNCVGQWMSSWKRNNWRKGSNGSEVINKDDLIILDETMKGIEIKWSYIPAHKGHVGNEGADRLAVEGSLKPLHR